MAKNSKIGWTHHTTNFWRGCNKIARECKECYIGAILRQAGLEPFHGPMRTKNWANPRRWDRRAGEAGVRERVFTCSISDYFHLKANPWRPEAWKVIKACRNLDWLILTKRPEQIIEQLPPDWGSGYPNVSLGVTCDWQKSLFCLDHLREIPARIKFVSAEPLLERMDFRPYLSWLDWVITGCERAKKGKRALMDLDWVRDIDRQCKDAGKPHVFKQAYSADKGLPCERPWLDGKVVQEFPLFG